MTSTPNKREDISLEEKYEIIKDKEKGMSVKDLVDKYKYGASTIYAITKGENIKKVLYALQSGELKRDYERDRKVREPEMLQAR